MDISKVKNNLVVSSNDLVHAKYDLTLWQKRVFVYAISQLDKDDKNFQPLKMNIADIISFFKGSDGVNIYNAILEAPKNLDKTIEIPYITEEGGLRYGFIKLLQKYSIPADNKSDNQYIEICFNSDLKPHLLDLKEKFLKYDIGNVIELQSTYSFRMFEILKSYEYRKSIELDIDYLRTILEVTNTYKAYKDFKRRIIDKAKEDLTKFCDITFTYEEKKGLKGKKIEALIFHIYKNSPKYRTKDVTVRHSSKKDKMTEVFDTFPEARTVKIADFTIVETDVTESTLHEKLMVELSPIVVTQFGVSFKMFMSLVEKNTEGAIRQAVKVTEKAIQTGKVANAAGFFVEALRGHYQDSVQQKKTVEAEKMARQKAKADAARLAEQDTQAQKAQAVRNESHRKINIIKDLIQRDAPLLQQAMEELMHGPLRTGYDPKTPIEQSLENALFAGRLMTMLQKLKPTIFE